MHFLKLAKLSLFVLDLTLSLPQTGQLLQLKDPLAVVEVVARLQDLLVDFVLAITPEVLQFPWHIDDTGVSEAVMIRSVVTDI